MPREQGTTPQGEGLGSSDFRVSVDERKRKWQPEEELAVMVLNYGGKDPISFSVAPERFGISPDELTEKIERGEIVALPFNETLVIPSWQLDDQGNVFSPLPELFRQMIDDPWGLADKLTSPQRNSDGEVPIDMMRAGTEETFDYLIDWSSPPVSG